MNLDYLKIENHGVIISDQSCEEFRGDILEVLNNLLEGFNTEAMNTPTQASLQGQKECLSKVIDFIESA